MKESPAKVPELDRQAIKWLEVTAVVECGNCYGERRAVRCSWCDGEGVVREPMRFQLRSDIEADDSLMLVLETGEVA